MLKPPAHYRGLSSHRNHCCKPLAKASQWFIKGYRCWRMITKHFHTTTKVQRGSHRDSKRITKISNHSYKRFKLYHKDPKKTKHQSEKDHCIIIVEVQNNFQMSIKWLHRFKLYRKAPSHNYRDPNLQVWLLIWICIVMT